MPSLSNLLSDSLRDRLVRQSRVNPDDDDNFQCYLVYVACHRLVFLEGPTVAIDSRKTGR